MKRQITSVALILCATLCLSCSKTLTTETLTVTPQDSEQISDGSELFLLSEQETPTTASDGDMPPRPQAEFIIQRSPFYHSPEHNVVYTTYLASLSGLQIPIRRSHFDDMPSNLSLSAQLTHYYLDEIDRLESLSSIDINRSQIIPATRPQDRSLYKFYMDISYDIFNEDYLYKAEINGKIYLLCDRIFTDSYTFDNNKKIAFEFTPISLTGYDYMMQDLSDRLDSKLINLSYNQLVNNYKIYVM